MMMYFCVKTFKYLSKIEEITIGQALKNTRKLNQNISMDTAVFLNQREQMYVKARQSVHIHSLSSDWERQPYPSKYFD